MLNECRFCNILKGNLSYEDIDNPFVVNKDFFAIASIGAFIEGWTLIVPKEHQFSLRKMYLKTEFIEVLKKTTPFLVSQYGPIIAFEHGSNREGSETSCGTDHAHLHLVPFQGSLVSHIQELDWEKCNISDIETLVGDEEYLFYSEIKAGVEWSDSFGYVHILDAPISQYFRKKLATVLEIGEVYNYKKFPCLEIAKKTRNALNKISV